MQNRTYITIRLHKHNNKKEYINITISTVTGCQPVTQLPNVDNQSTLFITPEAGWPRYTPRHQVTILVAFTTCMGCSGTNLFPGHHMERALHY
jgi:hypothetical protein